MVLVGCSQAPTPRGDSPGTNIRVNDIAIRYAHLEDPDDPAGYSPGDDVPLYVWFTNDADTALRLTDVTSPVAKEVTLSAGHLPVDLEPGNLTALGPTGPHLVMRDITRQIRGAVLVPVTLGFSDGTTVEVSVEAVQVKGPSESSQPSAARATLGG